MRLLTQCLCIIVSLPNLWDVLILWPWRPQQASVMTRTLSEMAAGRQTRELWALTLMSPSPPPSVDSLDPRFAKCPSSILYSNLPHWDPRCVFPKPASRHLFEQFCLITSPVLGLCEWDHSARLCLVTPGAGLLVQEEGPLSCGMEVPGAGRAAVML